MAILENQKVKVKWNNGNKNYYESLGYIFTKNGEEFEIDIKHISKSSRSIVIFTCDFCNTPFERCYKNATRHEHHFCSHECSVKHNSEEKLESRPWKVCEMCNKNYQVPNYRKESNRFCSRECLAKWNSENKQGENSPLWVERVLVNCDWCNKEVERTNNLLNKQSYNFCDRECKRNWHKEVLVKSDIFIENARNVMITNLNEGRISNINSKPQIIINELLDSKNIKYKNEVQINNYSIDIHLEESDLFVEINGGFWHCDNRFYNEINYDMQLKRIKSDKIKRTIVKRMLNKNILYLWEFDIETNINLCYKLICKYIENDGVLDNYHSFNYFLEGNGDLTLTQELIRPYVDWKANELGKITDLNVRKNVSKYQPEKHKTFNCDNCGEEKTQYIYHYNQCKNHFCSKKCANEFNKAKQK